MAINMTKARQHIESFKGKATYSQTGSRNFTDNPPTADCSGGVTIALVKAGAADKGLKSTVTLPDYLASQGFKKEWSGKTADTPTLRAGDIPLMTNATTMAGSGGDGGHVGIIGDNDDFVNVTATRWSDGATFVKGAAVQVPKWNDYKKVTRLKNLTEIWTLNGPFKTGSGSATVTISKVQRDGILGAETWRGIQKELLAIGHNLGPAGADGVAGYYTVKAFQIALVAKGGGTLDFDGVLGAKTIKKWQQVLKTTADGVISKPTSQLIYATQDAINSGKRWL